MSGMGCGGVEWEEISLEAEVAIHHLEILQYFTLPLWNETGMIYYITN